MNKEEYKKLINNKKPKEPKLKNALIAFFTGGFMGFFCEIISKILVVWLGVSKAFSYGIICFLLIFMASLFTALGFFDDLVVRLKCGLIIPTTGFAHSVTSSALEYKSDGMITGLGTNFFKLAGSVILYGIVSAFFLCLLKVICYA